MLDTLLKHLKEQKDVGLTNEILMETFKESIKPLKYSDREIYEEVVDNRSVLFFIDNFSSLEYNCHIRRNHGGQN